MKKCERCADLAISGNRFCKACKKLVLQELADSGYLMKRVYGHIGQGRTTDQKEDLRETKRGMDR